MSSGSSSSSASIGGAATAQSTLAEPRRAPRAALRRSLLGPTVFTIAGLILLLGLAGWQLERMQWKDGLNAVRHAGITAPPVPMPTSLAAARPLAFHHVALSGRFLNDRELYLFAMAKGDGAAGYHVITPFRRDDGSMLLIDRGFVPSDRRAPASRAAGEIAGETRVSGLLRLPPADRGWFTPANEPRRNQWYSIDLPAMAAAAGVGPVLPFYVDADARLNPGGLPIGGQTRVDLPNHHLNYAATWFGLALTLVIFYLQLLRRHRSLGESP